MRSLIVLLAMAGPAIANDGFGGLTSTGLTFGQTDAVAMEAEDLVIGFDRIAVSYRFRNITDADVTGEVIFPLPPISLSYVMMSDWNLPEQMDRENLVDFTASVDGRPVGVTIDRVAVIEPEWDPERPLSQQYDTPGRDVTEVLRRHRIPLSLEPAEVQEALFALSEGQRADLTAAGVAEFYTPPEGEQGTAEAWPLWSIVIRYHWTQTFPAGEVVTIEHGYENRSPGGLFYWRHPPDEWLNETIDRYCIDEETSKGIDAALPRTEDGEQGHGVAWNVGYVLRTANSWAGPIGHFRLTIDKGSEDRIVSLCADGIRKTGPTTFVMERENFVPEGDLDILIVGPMAD